MSVDRDVTPVVRSWLEQRGEGLADPSRGFDRFMQLVDTTPQVRRRWWAPGPPATTAHPARRSPSMVSATRLIAAMAIVALGAGAVFFTASPGPSPAVTPSPSPEWTPPPGLVTEELAPGVLLATNDGAGHPLRYQGPAPNTDFDFGPDGSLWILDGFRLFRAGHEGSVGLDGSGPPGSDLTAARDGTVWVLAQGSVAAFRDGRWEVGPDWPGSSRPTALEVQSDGTVWASDGNDLGRLDGDAWTIFPIRDGPDSVPGVGSGFGMGDLAATADGTVWVNLCVRDEVRLLRLDGSTFVEDSPPVERAECSGSLEAGPDGALWVVVHRRYPLREVLARRDATGWTLYAEEAGVPDLGERDEGGSGASIIAARDGRLWGTAGRDRSEVIGYFDGTAWTDVHEVPNAPDGSVLCCGRPRKVAPDGTFWILLTTGILIVDPEVAMADR